MFQGDHSNRPETCTRVGDELCCFFYFCACVCVRFFLCFTSQNQVIVFRTYMCRAQHLPAVLQTRLKKENLVIVTKPAFRKVWDSSKLLFFVSVNVHYTTGLPCKPLQLNALAKPVEVSISAINYTILLCFKQQRALP